MSISRTWMRLAAGTTAAVVGAAGFLVATPAAAETPPMSQAIVTVPNGGFEDFTAPNSWVAANWSMTSTVWLTNAAAHSGTYSQTLDQWNDSTTLSQTLTAPEGTYDVSLFVWANEDVGSSALVANGASTPIRSGGATQIDGTKTWDEIVLADVPVGADGALDIQIVLPQFSSTTLSGFLDDVTVVPSTGGGEPEPTDSLLNEPGFEEGGAAWRIGGDVLTTGRNGTAHSVRHSAPNSTETSQTVDGLAEGYYRLTAWVQNDGGYDDAYLFASGAAPQMRRRLSLAQSSRTTLPVRGGRPLFEVCTSPAVDLMSVCAPPVPPRELWSLTTSPS